MNVRWPAVALAAAVVCSIIVAAVGSVTLPRSAEIVHHSSGSTWSLGTATFAYPLVVAGVAAVTGAFTGARRDVDRDVWLALGVTWFVVAFQTWAYFTAS